MGVLYRVVIIDDEPVIVRGLSQLVPWQKYGCEVVGTAEDGQEGLELIRRLRPHMVFSDIYMPQMDGLTMAAALKSEFEDMELTVLTGYRDFELAQRAIHIGVRRFLLKPSNMEELEEAVGAMAAQLRRRGIMGSEPDMGSVQGGGEAAAGPAEFGAAGSVAGSAASSAGGAAAGSAAKSAAESSKSAAVPDSAAGRFIINKALEYMHGNYSHKMTLTDVAEHTYVSQWHLSKLLNRHTGQSFSELLNTIRIDEAKKLLVDPSLRIGDIAELVGFLDMAHFSRVFKKITGISANEYRNQL